MLLCKHAPPPIYLILTYPTPPHPPQVYGLSVPDWAADASRTAAVAAEVSVEPFVPKENVKIETGGCRAAGGHGLLVVAEVAGSWWESLLVDAAGLVGRVCWRGGVMRRAAGLCFKSRAEPPGQCLLVGGEWAARRRRQE